MKIIKKLDATKEKYYKTLFDRLSSDENYDLSNGQIRLAGDFYKNQLRIALQNYDIVNPESIEEYIALGGYYALHKGIFEMSPQEIIDEIKASNL